MVLMMEDRDFAYQEMTSTTSPLLELEEVRVCAISSMDGVEWFVCKLN